MTEYSASIASAQRIIAKKGDACVWRQFDVEPGTTDWTEDATATFTDYPVKIVFLPNDGRMLMTFIQVDGDVTRYVSYGLMGAVSFTPLQRDMIIRSDGQIVKPAGIQELKPASEVVLYTIGFDG